MIRRGIFVLAILLFSGFGAKAFAETPSALIDPEKPAEGWQFGDGPEFPGARGELTVAAEPFRGKPVLSLHGDFTGGGNYVQAETALPTAKIGRLSFWVNSPTGSERLPIRLMDENNKVHQLNLRLNPKGGWQQIVLPVDDFFRKMGTPDALDVVTRYESWDGAQDARRNQKDFHAGPRLAILASRAMGGDKGTILLSDMQLVPSDRHATSVTKTVRLDDMLQEGVVDWQFNLGQEFPGAKGGLDLVQNQPAPGTNAMRLHADFTEGGAYVGVRRSFEQFDVLAINALRMKMRSETTRSFAVRLVDGTGQCHQRKDVPFEADGRWHDVEIVPAEIAGGEHWGGANDGAWHNPIRLVELMLNDRSAPAKKPDLTISQVAAVVTVKAEVKPAAFAEDFNSARPGEPPAAWQTAGTVRVETADSDAGGNALALERSLQSLSQDTWAAGPTFDVAPGMWQVEYATKARLHSPDNSYHGSVELEVLSGGGALIETVPLGITCGTHDWQTTSKPVELPRGASNARFRIRLNKTYGTFRVDGLSASPLGTGLIERRIERVLLATDAVGNLFLPSDKVAFHVTVEAVKPLAEAERVVRYSVRDYWGAEQIPPGKVALEKAAEGRTPFVYTAALVLPADRLAVGKYYELHAAVPQGTGEPVREYSGLAVLPRAVTKDYPPEAIPFTIRNWDSRIPVYFDLADRLGLRLIGVWGGWSAKPPYKPHCPGLERCEKLGAKWITGTPASSVERNGFDEYSEQSLRQGMTSFLHEYAGRGLAMIAMGNEPHGTGEKVLENVRAYKAIYEAVKAFDPSIHVIGTSVEPNEEYFKAGYQNYLDSYDFHIYEHYTNVRRTIREYRELMEKYHAVKPIHSTELGLNSQGQTRQAVAVEMVKKFTVFFAEGGATASWFTIQYPDPQGKARGQFGDSHCVFDCKYNLYNPRLDAITYYDMVNGIADKKFVAERQYPDGADAYLFRNSRGNCLLVAWRDDGRKDVLVRLPANRDIELVHLDGSRTRLASDREGITLSLSDEPVLVFYDEPKGGLAETLGPPAFALEAAPKPIRPGGVSVFILHGEGLAAESLGVDSPPRWKATLRQAGPDRVECTVQAPPETPAREGRLYVRLLSEAKPIGELALPVRVTRPR